MKSDGENEIVRDEVFELCEKSLNGDLCAETLARLEVLVTGDPQARKFYVEYMHQHAGLHWQHSAGEEAFSLHSLLPESTGNENEAASSEHSPMEKKVVPGPWGLRRVSAAAAMLIGGLLLGLAVAGKKSPEPSVATLVKAANCSWQGGSLPTAEGAELRAGRLRLQEGLAKLKFVSGAELTLEAPVDIELISAMRCRLHRGTVVAKIPEQAQGFTIETEGAKLVDYGTEFGVHVGAPGKETNVLVFDGVVDVEQIKSGEVRRLTTGNGSIVSDTIFEITESASLELVSGNAASFIMESNGKDTVTITTADGRGEDTYVQAMESDIHNSQVLLLSKNSEVFDANLGYSRKIYLRFDLDHLSADRAVSDAALVLAVKRSDFGYASFVGDAEFVVYGLRDDRWERDEITWGNAPGNNHTGSGADMSEAIELGTFTIPQGIYSGNAGIEGNALANFLRQENKRDGMATFLIVRRTGEIRRGGGLVHAFASKRHPGASPPTLRIKLAE